mmetsp:Transcript_83027/g.222669  ORF Transcript_83027/g.222669 Transcript_83027/m.222669 type:complete len:207 (-) Transcript_83027:106-726(-)
MQNEVSIGWTWLKAKDLSLGGFRLDQWDRLWCRVSCVPNGRLLGGYMIIAMFYKKEFKQTKQQQQTEKIVYIHPTRPSITLACCDIKRGKAGVALPIEGNIGRLYGVEDKLLTVLFESSDQAECLVQYLDNISALQANIDDQSPERGVDGPGRQAPRHPKDSALLVRTMSAPSSSDVLQRGAGRIASAAMSGCQRSLDVPRRAEVE